MRHEIKYEKNYLFEPQAHVIVAVALDEVSENQVESAVVAAYNANEATRSRVVMEEDGRAFFEAMAETACTVSRSAQTWQEVVESQQKIPFDLRRGELMRAFILPAAKGRLADPCVEGTIEDLVDVSAPSEEDSPTAQRNTGDCEAASGCVLLLIGHHLAGDGKGLLCFVDCILRSLAGDTLKYRPLRQVDLADFERRAKLSPIVKMYARKMNRDWQKFGSRFGWEEYRANYETYWNTHVNRYFFTRYSAHQVAEMKRICKQADVTINSFLVTDLLRVHPACSKVGVPTSMRTNDSLSNQTSGIDIAYRYNPSISFERNLQAVHQAIRSEIDNPRRLCFILPFMARLNPGLVDAMLMSVYSGTKNKTAEALAKRLDYLKAEDVQIGVTNLGVLDFPEYPGGARVSDAIFLAPKIGYAGRVFSAATINNELVICETQPKPI